MIHSELFLEKRTTHRLWSRGAAGGARPPPHFLALGGQGGAHHFELQPLVCIVFSGKVITLTQQCITKVIKVTTNSQQDPYFCIFQSYFLKFFHTMGGGSPLPHPPLLARYARPRARFTRIMRPPPTFKVAPKPMLQYL